jgi:L-serine dehydratase
MGFLDIIGPVMIGPSSSHTAGAARLGRLAKACWGNEPFEEVTVFLRGSFAFTGRGHGTDKAVIAGLMGMLPDDEGIRTALDEAKKKHFPYRLETEHVDGAHPNSARFAFRGKDGHTLEVVGASIGGGAVELQEVDGFSVAISGDLPTLITFHKDTHGVVAAVAALLANRKINIASMTLHRKARGGMASLVTEMDMDGPPDEALRSAVAAAHPAILRVAPIYSGSGRQP